MGEVWEGSLVSRLLEISGGVKRVFLEIPSVRNECMIDMIMIYHVCARPGYFFGLWMFGTSILIFLFLVSYR